MTSDIGHVVIIDADAVTRDALACYLSYNQVPAKAAPGKAELDRLLADTDPSLIILDLRRGPDDGFGVLRELRSRSDVPIILTSGDHLDHVDCILGLELGADDYIVKPLNPRVVLARVRAVLRRFHRARVERPIESEQGEYGFGGWKLDCGSRRLLNPDGALVPLGRNEYDLLLAFLRAPLRTLTREYLLQGTRLQQEGGIRRLDAQVLRLRRKLENTSNKPGFIRTERGIGYIFTAAVVRPLLKA
jgi:two-component system OmpR family response regulator